MSHLSQLKLFNTTTGGKLLGIIGNAVFNRNGHVLSKAALCLAGRVAWSKLAHTETDMEALPDFAEEATGILLDHYNNTSLGKVGVGLTQLVAANIVSSLQTPITKSAEAEAISAPPIPSLSVPNYQIIRLPVTEKIVPPASAVPALPPVTVLKNLPITTNQYAHNIVEMAQMRWTYAAEQKNAAASTITWQQFKISKPALAQWLADYHAARLHNATQRNIFTGDNRMALEMALQNYLAHNAGNQATQLQSGNFN